MAGKVIFPVTNEIDIYAGKTGERRLCREADLMGKMQFVASDTSWEHLK